MISENINPLRLIRISLDMRKNEISKYFDVTGSYFGMVEKGKRKLDNAKLRNGLESLGITLVDYLDFYLFCERIDSLEIDSYDKYKYCLIKAIGLVNYQLRDESSRILEEIFSSSKVLK